MTFKVSGSLIPVESQIQIRNYGVLKAVPVSPVNSTFSQDINFFIDEATKGVARATSDFMAMPLPGNSDVDVFFDLDDILEVINKDGSATMPIEYDRVSPVMFSNETLNSEVVKGDNDVDKYFAQPPPYRPSLNLSPQLAERREDPLSTINLADLELETTENNNSMKQQQQSLLLKYLTANTVVSKSNAIGSRLPPNPIIGKKPQAAFSLGGAQNRTVKPPHLSTLVQAKSVFSQNLQYHVNGTEPVSLNDLPGLIREPVITPLSVLHLEQQLPRDNKYVYVQPIRHEKHDQYPKSTTVHQESVSHPRMGKRPSFEMSIPSPPKLPKLDIDVSRKASTSDVINTPDLINLLLGSSASSSDSERASSDNERLETPQTTPPRSRRSTAGSIASESRRSTPSPVGEMARRERNNAASRRSRQNRKKREEEQNKLLEMKDNENRELQRKVDLLEAEKQALKQLVSEIFTSRIPVGD